jgi:elongator complex protein 3
VQSVYDDALKNVKRGHTVADTIRSIRELKDLGFKINAHVMPGMPGISRERDLAGLQELFSNPAFRPDMLKIYPLMVMPGTPLHDDWKKGKFTPLQTEDAAELISAFKATVPAYCRIMRVQRDIPTKLAVAGVSMNNLRERVQELMKEKGTRCACIRCREDKEGCAKNPKLSTLAYGASEGKEYFISFEDENYLVGFARLRFPSQSLRKEITLKTALLRELHVYGPARALESSEDIHKKGAQQHKGYGIKLLREAEKISQEHGKSKLVVISGVGARDYYRKLGYKKEGPYMVKKL